MTPMFRRIGFVHERKITLSPQGLMLTGADRLVAAASRQRPNRLSRCGFTSIPM